MKKKLHTKESRFHFYEVLKLAKLIYSSIKKTTVVASRGHRDWKELEGNFLRR